MESGGSEKRRKILLNMLEAVYVDTVEETMFVHIRDLYALSDLPLVIHRVKSAIRLDNEQIVGETPVLPPGARWVLQLCSLYIGHVGNSAVWVCRHKRCLRGVEFLDDFPSLLLW